ncbi:MAG: hypothetical protein HY613_08710 [Candidatus Rokubacteria bacterium]|nr:hypothetical protein [Candidatus Rokubacteria bacterium]
MKLLLVGPGQKVPADAGGSRVIESPSTMVFTGYRILNPDKAVAKAEFERSRMYRWSQRDNPPPQKHVWASGKTFIQAAPRGMEYWERVNEIIQREPVHERDRFFMAMLKPLGIDSLVPIGERRLLFLEAKASRTVTPGVAEPLACLGRAVAGYKTDNCVCYRGAADVPGESVLRPGVRNLSVDRLGDALALRR